MARLAGLWRKSVPRSAARALASADALTRSAAAVAGVPLRPTATSSVPVAASSGTGTALPSSRPGSTPDIPAQGRTPAALPAGAASAVPCHAAHDVPDPRRQLSGPHHARSLSVPRPPHGFSSSASGFSSSAAARAGLRSRWLRLIPGTGQTSPNRVVGGPVQRSRSSDRHGGHRFLQPDESCKHLHRLQERGLGGAARHHPAASSGEAGRQGGDHDPDEGQSAVQHVLGVPRALRSRTASGSRAGRPGAADPSADLRRLPDPGLGPHSQTGRLHGIPAENHGFPGRRDHRHGMREPEIPQRFLLHP